jgi:lysozyme
MKVENSTLELIRKVEGEKLTAYLCTKKVPTISFGVTIYPNGSKVKLGDVVTKEKSKELFFECSKERENSVNKLVTSKLTQNQWDVMFSICWQYGASWLKKSLILKQVNKDQNNILAIKTIFGLMGYKNRRAIELNHYTT